MTGVNSVGEAVELYSEGKVIFQEASLNLREWASSSSCVIDVIPPEDKVKSDTVTFLGHNWDLINDTLSIKPVSVETDVKPSTKCVVLKTIASVFNPLGFVTPVVLRGKLLLQEIWIQNL